MPASTPLQSFNPHAAHYFTSAVGNSSTPSPSRNAGLPAGAYPTHIVTASTSPSRVAAQPPKNSSVPSQTTPAVQNAQTTPVPMQSPQPRPLTAQRGFDTGQASFARMEEQGRPIYEVFHHQRALTPELDAILKKKTSSWGAQELEESLTKN